MAVKPSTKPATAPVTYRALTGTRTAPLTPYRALRQAKGYGRVALAAALGVTTSQVWALENHTTGADAKKALAALAALPNVGKATGVVPAAGLPGAPVRKN